MPRNFSVDASVTPLTVAVSSVTWGLASISVSRKKDAAIPNQRMAPVIDVLMVGREVGSILTGVPCLLAPFSSGHPF